jgi:hypothetical protein
MFEEANSAIRRSAASTGEKHVLVLYKTSALCRNMGGTVAVLCKSGKDRTGMGSTLELTRVLVETFGAMDGPDICTVLRTFGVRRMNVYANTGQPMFAFNNIQRTLLPACYRPPAGTFNSKVET